MEAKKDTVTRHDLRHDRHTISLLTDHLVFSPRYRGKVLEGAVSEVAEEVIRETCRELDIEVIDMAVNADHVHLFIKHPPEYSVSWIAKWIKGRSSKLLRDRFPQLKEWCPGHPPVGAFVLPWLGGQGWVVERYISGQKNYYRKEDAIPVVVVDEEKEKTHKIGYITLYTKFFAVTGSVLKYGV